VSSPSDPQPPVAPGGSRQPSTQEIPVVQPAGATAATTQLPPHPDAAPPAPVPVQAPQPTGPVDFVPGLPGLGTPPVPPPAATPPLPPAAPVPPQAAPTPAPSWPDTLESDILQSGTEANHPGKERRFRAQGDRTPRDRTPRDRAALIGLGLVVLSLVLLELGLALDFDGVSYWSVVPLWSAFATLCALLGLLVFAAFYPAGNRLRMAAGGLVGLAAFWLLVVLPAVDTDRGFVLTAALAALGGALWIGPRRKD
jgi:hypothetical protein